MAENAVVGALRVVIGADTAKFEEGLKKAAKDLDGFSAAISKTAAATAAAVVASGALLATAVKHSIDQAEQLNKASQKIGVPVEQLSSLKYAAELADVSFEALSTSMTRLAKNMSAVAGGAQNEAGKAFQALGVSVKQTDGSLKSSTQVMEELSEKFAGLEDGAAKTALAVAIFGRAGAQMIPLLNQGAKGLNEATEEAKQFGLIISTETAKSAEAFNDNLKRMEKIMQGVSLQITAQLLPTMEDLSTALIAVVKNSDGMQIAVKAIDVAVRAFALTLVVIGGKIAEFVRGIQLIIEVSKNITSIEGMRKAWDQYVTVGNAAAIQNQEIIKALLGMHSAILPVIDDWQQLTKVVATRALQPAPIIATENALDKFIKTTQKSTEAQKAEVAAIGQAAGTKERLKIVYEGLQIATANNIPVTEALRAKLNAVALEAGNLQLKLEGLRSIQETLPLWQQYQQAIANSDAAMIRAGATMDQIAAKNKKIAEQFGATWEQASASVAGSLSEMVGAFAGENKKLVQTSKALGAASALISAYQASSQALATGVFPANLAAAAAVLAKGLSFVAAIKGVGFAEGGTFRIGGGMTGIDSEMVAFKGAPGEIVDVRRPGQERGGGGGGVQTIELRAPRAGDFFSENIRELVDSINRAAPDGYIIRMPAA